MHDLLRRRRRSWRRRLLDGVARQIEQPAGGSSAPRRAGVPTADAASTMASGRAATPRVFKSKAAAAAVGRQIACDGAAATVETPRESTSATAAAAVAVRRQARATLIFGLSTQIPSADETGTDGGTHDLLPSSCSDDEGLVASSSCSCRSLDCLVVGNKLCELSYLQHDAHFKQQRRAYWLNI